jgi:electron transfer flavoprotein beta subunit
VESPIPALITCQKGLNEPRYAALKGIMAAKKKPVEKIEVASFGIEEGADPFYRVESLTLPPEKAAGTIIKGEDDPSAAAAELVKLLREEAKAI